MKILKFKESAQSSEFQNFLNSFESLSMPVYWAIDELSDKLKNYSIREIEYEDKELGKYAVNAFKKRDKIHPKFAPHKNGNFEIYSKDGKKFYGYLTVDSKNTVRDKGFQRNDDIRLYPDGVVSSENRFKIDPYSIRDDLYMWLEKTSFWPIVI